MDISFLMPLPIAEALGGIQIHNHLCQLAENPEEQLAVAVTFIGQGLERGEGCVFLTGTATKATLLEALAGSGVDVAAAQGNGRLLFSTSREPFVHEGCLVLERVIGFLAEEAHKAKAAGLAGLRFLCDATWLFDDDGALVSEYEARINHLVPQHDIMVLCQYQRPRFRAEALQQVIRSHPWLFHTGTLCRNFFCPPLPPSGAADGEAEVQWQLTKLLHWERTAQEYRDYQGQCQAILETTCDGFLTFAEDGRILATNNAYCLLTGFSRTELLGMTIGDLRRYDSAEVIAHHYQAIKGKGSSRFMTRHHGKDGRIITVEVSCTYIPHGRRFVSFIRDITAQQQTEEQLRQALQRSEILLREVNHRVKNNLGIILALLNMQGSRILDPASKKAFLDTQTRIYSMATVHQMLDRAQNLSGSDLPHFVRTICHHLGQTYLVNQDQVEFSLVVDSIPLGVDKAIPFGLIVNELVSNVLKHAFPNGRPGRLHVAVEAGPGGQVNLTVQDNGIGFSFEPSAQGQSSLGLRIVDNLVRQLAGNWTIERKEDTTVRVSFQAQVP